MENSIPDRYEEETGMYSIKKETPGRNRGCKPKPTAYEKTFIYKELITIF